MTEQRPEHRARRVSFGGLLLQILLTIGFTLLWTWTQSEAIKGLFLFSACGLPVWLVLVLVYHQRVLVQDEAFEIEQLRKEREHLGGSIFDVDKEELMLARRRLRMMYKWMLPAFTVIIIAALAGTAQWGFGWGWGGPGEAYAWPEVRNPFVAAGFVAGIAFVCFLMSRYVVGMARYAEWRMLHAGATFLMGITLAAAICAGMLFAMVLAKNPGLETLMAQIIRIMLMVLAVEILISFILDFYRPRGPDEEPHLAFDSRLLGLFTEPGGIAKSIADAINYQFGFEVSSTWMYQLLQRSFGPLIGFAVVTLVAASCFVFVEANEVGIVERFGAVRMASAPEEGQQHVPALLEPGLHVKLPWPIDQVRKVAVGKLHSLQLGTVPEAGETPEKEEKLFLWTNKHPTEPHLAVLIATPSLQRYLPEEAPTTTTRPLPPEEAATETATGADITELASPSLAVPVSQLRLSVTIQYMIRDPYKWLYHNADPEQLLEALADREVMRYCASVDIEGILGQEQERIETDLLKALSAKVAEEDIGIEIVFLGILGVHPPADTAEAFQKVTGAEQEAAAAINSARSDYNKTLAQVAGNHLLAEQLAEAIRHFNDLQKDSNTSPEALDKARSRIDALVFGDPDSGRAGVGGEAAGIIAKGRAERWVRENKAHAEHVTFLEEMKVKNAAPGVYAVTKYMEALAKSLDGIRKYVVATANAKVDQSYLDLRRPLTVQLRGDQSEQ